MISKLRSVFFLQSLLFKAAFTIGAGVSTRHEDKCEPFFFQVARPKFRHGAGSRVRTVLWY